MKLTLNICCLLFVLVMTAQEVDLTQNYEFGHTYQYELIRGKEDSRYPAMEGVRTSTEVNMIFSKNNEGIINEISYGSTITYDAQGGLMEKNLSSTSDLFNGFSFKIVLDKQGKFTKILDFSVVQKDFENYLFKMTKDPESFKDLVFKTYQSEKAFLINYFPEIVYHFDIYGSKSTPIFRTHFNQNPLGGESIPMKLSLNLKEQKNNQIILTGKETIKDEDISKIIETTIIEISKKRGQEVNLSSIPKLSMENDVVYKYDIEKKFLTEVSVVKISESQGMTAKKYNILKLRK